MRGLVVEDDAALRKQLVTGITAAGFVVDSAGDGIEAEYFGLEYPYDIAVIDLGLPRRDGMSVIRRLRSRGCRYPILILTARDRWQDKVAGLDAGADDYLVKPFQMPELVARLRALVRRTGGWADSVIACPPLKLDTREQRAYLEDAELDLTAYEYQLLAYLMLHAGEVVSKTELTEHLYPDDASRDSNVLEVFIRRLRQKLDPDECLNPIETLRGRGYRLALPRA
ncbi:winged helix-turn-helix domain-containing protein [Immundisolibacter sp.]|uniref:winged helix-turn-helix domain-containing protein n=1 Tax=Immundisolibacter sp. TaxID=1934948 RepID=UPI00356379C2